MASRPAGGPTMTFALALRSSDLRAPAVFTRPSLGRLAVIAALTALCLLPSHCTVAELLAGIQDGLQVAALARSQRPVENTEIRSLLKTRDADGRRRELPVKISTVAGEHSWRIVYEVLGPADQPLERLTVLREADQPPRYQLHRAAGVASGATEPPTLDGEQALVPFGGTDFWLADLGLHFLWWPDQRVVTDAKITMRKGVACKVLDSFNPNTRHAGYARVRSWLALENGALIYAEAYDSRNQILKVFEVSNVEKVNGRWELKELKIRNEQSDSVTRLEFNLQIEQP